MKVYAVFDKEGDLIWAWPLKNGREWIAGDVKIVEIDAPEKKKGTTVTSMIKTSGLQV